MVIKIIIKLRNYRDKNPDPGYFSDFIIKDGTRISGTVVYINFSHEEEGNEVHIMSADGSIVSVVNESYIEKVIIPTPLYKAIHGYD